MNFVKLIGIATLVAVIGFSFAACGGGGGNTGRDIPTNGSLTITGLEDYNGKYIMASYDNRTDVVGQIGSDWEIYNYSGLSAWGNYTTTGSYTNATIIDGKATLKVWAVAGTVTRDNTTAVYSDYSGNDQNVRFVVSILNSRNMLDRVDTGSVIAPSVTVSFTDGEAEGSVHFPN